MKALISPNEPCETGYRIAQVAQEGFDVCPPLFWVDCGNDIQSDLFWYDPETSEIKLVPQPEPDIQLVGAPQPVVDGAQSL